MGNKIDVLDHGFVRLVSYMQPVPDTKTDDWTGDLEISRNARVSYDAPGRPEDEKLINYLLKNGHNTPFEAMTATFEVKAPIFVLRQWHRHRTWSFNELSARYRELPEEFYVPSADVIGCQAKDNKQMRDISDQLTGGERDFAEQTRTLMKKNNETSFKVYRGMLSKGVPRELARTVLPLATYSHMFGTVNLHNLFKFLEERLHKHAQWEIQQYAQAMLKLVEPVAPVAVAAFFDHKMSGPY